MKSATSWQEYTNRPEFLQEMQKIISDPTRNNEQRAEAMENFILE
jgi:hypothetical protein